MPYGFHLLSLTQFIFSSLTGADVLDDPEQLDKFLANPRAALPGTTMTFAGINNPDRRAELIAYLRNELASAARDTVAHHLEGCPSCRETSAAFRALLDDLGHGPAATPPGAASAG